MSHSEKSTEDIRSEPMTPELHTIGEVTRLTGLTHRMLRHYEEQGLVVPSGRSEGGHRLYSASDLERLMKVALLRQLEVPLPDIQQILDDHTSWKALLPVQLQRLQERITRMQLTRHYLKSLAMVTDLEDHLPLEQVQQVLREMGRARGTGTGQVDWQALSKQLEQQAETMRQRWMRLSEPARQVFDLLPNLQEPTPLNERWMTHLKEARVFVEQGTPVSDPEVEDFIHRFDRLWTDTFGPDSEVSVAAATLLTEMPADLGFYPVDPEVRDFFNRAYDHHIGSSATEKPAPDG